MRKTTLLNYIIIRFGRVITKRNNTNVFAQTLGINSGYEIYVDLKACA